ncbi:leucine-rich repeat domain-containing protein [uncultured Porphyromonas sp.]|uniref:leucine-rich repeat domain-containing protein n=1 Tax=uncultured Porphyromonas sp. TaxID=159274 RepID=UPI0028045080|nr:leucine-rich repeat domain-containing protein [uncultured Porphyromonas sp.]
MTRRLHRWACVLLCTLLTSIGLQAEESSQPSSTTSDALRTVGTGVITMTTTKAVGEKITLEIWGGNVTIEGVKEPFSRGSAPYTLTGQTVIIRGNVTKFNGWNNKLTNLNVSSCTILTSLKCFGNKLTSLDVSGCTALTELKCNDNQLTSLDVSSCTALTTLDCYRNKLTSLNVSGCTALTTLKCYDNQLTALDVSQNTALTRLDCYDNQLTALDVSQNTALTRLDCYRNQLTALDVSKKTKLETLNCQQNQLTALDVSKNTKLETLNCQQNQLTALDVSQNTELTNLNCQQNQLTALDVSQNIVLTKLSCSDNKLTALDVSENTVLTKLFCGINQLTALDVSQNTALIWLDCFNNKLTMLDLSKNTALTTLGCFNNKLTALDVSQNTALEKLYCSDNQLTALDVSKNTALTELFFDGNKLTALDVSQNTALIWLVCYNNQLTALDVSKNTALGTLRCHGNQIKGEEMTRLVNSLPDRTGKRAGNFTVVQEPAPEGNICLKSDVAIAKGKNWNTLKYKSDTRKYVAYEGEEETQPLKVTLTKEGEGTLTATGADNLNAVPEGTELTIVATPADGYKLTALTANGTDILATKKFVVKGATEVKATFTKMAFTVTLTKEGEGTLTATGADDLTAVPYGTELTIAATPTEGYELTALTANGTDILATKKFVVKGATEVKATFSKKSKPEYRITFTTDGNGTLNAIKEGAPFTSGSTAREGDKIIFTAQPATGYKVDKWLLSEAEIELTPYTGLATFECTVGTADVLLKTTFVQQTFSVTLTSNEHGTISIVENVDLKAVPYGTPLTVQATGKNDQCELTALTANGEDILATKQFVVKGATEVKATFVDHTNIAEVNTEAIRFYPNPAREYIIVEGTLPATLVTLYSMEGMRLYEDETDAEGTLRIDLSAYAEGTYLLRIADQIHRIIVQH